MTQTIEITAKTRNKSDATNNALREQGLVPAVLYGPGADSLSLVLNTKEIEKVAKEAGENSLVSVKVEGDGSHTVLIHDMSRHPVSGDLLHVDLYKVNLKKVVTAAVPLVFVGDAPAVKDLGGILVKNIYELEVEALPTDLPHQLEVDLASLKAIEDHITIADIKVPSEVKILANASDIIVVVAPPRAQEELEAAPEEVVGEIKTEREVKKAEAEAKAAEEAEVKE